MVALLLGIPVAAALVTALAPSARAARLFATLGCLAFFVVSVLMGLAFDWSQGAEFQFRHSIDMGLGPALRLETGADAVSMMLILLTGLLAPLCVIGSYTAIQTRERTFYAWLTALQAPMVGVFLARDLMTFYVSFEFTLLPMFVLISLFGSTNRRYAGVKFFLYTFTGSLMTLAGLLYVAWFNATRAAPGSWAGAGEWTIAIDSLLRAARSMSGAEQGWVLLALMAGFAVKTPLFPAHTWLPLAHTEAPTAGSVVLAGVLLKLGTYGLYRFVIPFVPDAVTAWAPLIAGVSIVGILYGGLICWVQRDVKKLVAYSSVAHLGFCVLGLFALNAVGSAGSVLYMLNHGLSTGALFFCVGMMYERYHTRSLEEVGGLARRMPVWATFMVFFTMASVGLPGLNGFISEIMCLLGAFQSGARWGVGGTSGPLGPWYAGVAALGMIVAAMYLLFMVGRIVFGPLREPAGHGHDHHSGSHGDEHGHGAKALPADLTAREIGVLIPLALGCILLGVYPRPALKALEAPVQANLAGVIAASEARRAVAEAQRATPAPATPTPAHADAAPAHGTEAAR